ncbi:MAG: LemA family protein [Gammaproteobacteria bacterium]|nr:LemA family protein [Gammaproteobacteria bacterium]
MTITVITVSASIVLIWLILIYNKLIRDKNRVLTAWSDIDVQLKRRHDLIPKLVEAVRQYAEYESVTIEAVTELRKASELSDDVTEISQYERALGEKVSSIYALAENYPDLKASNSYLNLQNNLTDVENNIQYARRYYNGSVNNLNVRIDSFPDMIVARWFRFSRAAFFDFDEPGQND